jgi:hypothetical protein
MLTLNLIIVHLRISHLAWSRVVSGTRLLRIPLLLVVLVHYAHLSILARIRNPSAFTPPRLLNRRSWSLALGRGHSLVSL